MPIELLLFSNSIFDFVKQTIVTFGKLKNPTLTGTRVKEMI